MSLNPIVFDTNCWVSLFLNSEGTAGQAARLGLTRYTVFHSPETLQELRTVLNRPEFDKYAPRESRMMFTNSIAASGQSIVPIYRFEVFRDPADNKFFDLAYSAGSECIVSGDEKHVQPFKHFLGIQIWSPAQFLTYELQRHSDPTPSVSPRYNLGMRSKGKTDDNKK